jgi:anaerobic selenocysteine-containing dehydrogenase
MPAEVDADTVKEHRSFCRFCEALCGIVVTVDGSQVLGVRGDPEHPISAGYTCPKGRSLPSFHHADGRLDRPRIVRDGRTEHVGWDRTLTDLAERIGAIVATHGADSVGVYLGTGSGFDPAGRRAARQLIRALGSRSVYTSATVDTPCKPLVAELMGGQPMLMPLIDEERPGLTLLIGTNPVVSHGHLNAFASPRTRLRRLAAEGELWVVDPRRTETAALATEHLRPRPATDHVWLAWLVRELLAEPTAGLEQRAIGVDALRAAVAPFDLARTVRETGLSAEDLTRLRDAIGRRGGLAGQTGTGSTMAPNANLTEWLLWAVHVLTDSFDRPGTTWFNPGFVCGFDRSTRSATDAVPGVGPASRPELPRRYGEYPCAAIADEIEAGNLRALLVVGGNPALALPDAERLTAALGRLDVLVVADVIENETSAQATHVLPVAGQLERADLPHFIDQLQPAVVAQYTPAVVPLAAERRPMWWVFARLAAALGHDVLPGADLDTATDDDALAPLMTQARMPLAELVQHDGAVVAAGAVFGWASALLRGGRWDLAPQPLVDQLAAHRLTTGLTLLPHRQPRHLNSQLAASGTSDGRQDGATIVLHPADAQEHGLSEGHAARLSAAGSSLVGNVHLDPDLQPGVVLVPHGFGAPNVNVLTSDTRDVDALTGMVVLSGLPVEIALA